VSVVAADGTERFDQVPLTLEDVLFPEVGDFIVQTRRHNSDVKYLGDVFEARLAGDSEAVVISDCRVDWNLPGVRPLGPDVAIFFDVKRSEDWDTFNVAAEGAHPALVVEVTSRTTRKNDLGPKVKFYHRAKVPLYLIADATGRGARRRLKLIGYRYTRRGYSPIAPDAQGRIYLEAVRLWVGVMHDRRGGYQRLACYDPVTGAELGDYTAVAEALAVSQEQAQAAQLQAQAAQLQAQAAKRQATAANRRARAEIQARVEAEARIRELEAELKRSRGHGS
jgi:Uma2 family endonuclease